MPNRTYLDLSRELDSNEGLYKSIGNKYEKIISSLTSDDVDPKLKDAILAGIWNAKSWYGLNGKLLDSEISSSLTHQEMINYNNYWLSTQQNIWNHRDGAPYYNWTNNTTIGGPVDWAVVTAAATIKHDWNQSWYNAQMVAGRMARHVIDYAMPDIFRCIVNWAWNHMDLPDEGRDVMFDYIIGKHNDPNVQNATGEQTRFTMQTAKFGNWLKRDHVVQGAMFDGVRYDNGNFKIGIQSYNPLISAISSCLYHWITTPRGPLKNYWTYPYNTINETNALIQSTTSMLNNMNSNLNSLTNLLTQVNSQGLSGWGYDWGLNDYGNELYLHMGKLDEINDSGTALQSTYLALDQLAEINEDMDTLLENYENLILPQNLNITKSPKDIDYEKINVKLFKVNDGSIINIDVNNISSYDDFSKIELPDGLQQGTYMLKITNKNRQIITDHSTSASPQGSWIITLQNEVTDLMGWYINGKYPIIKSILLSNKTYEVWTGLIDEIRNGNDTNFVEEYYIDPVSLIIEVKQNYEKLIYNFFYGSFFDEYIETLDNGNKIYYRQMKDINGNPTASYKIEVDYVNILENGMPLLRYARYDFDEIIQQEQEEIT